jgi:hypothetical protein
VQVELQEVTAGIFSFDFLNTVGPDGCRSLAERHFRFDAFRRGGLRNV